MRKIIFVLIAFLILWSSNIVGATQTADQQAATQNAVDEEVVDDEEGVGEITHVVTKEMSNGNAMKKSISKEAIGTEEATVTEAYPTANIFSPSNGAVLEPGKTYLIQVDFCDRDVMGYGTTKAELYIDNVLVQDVSASKPLVMAAFSWTTPKRAGIHAIQAFAYNDAGDSAESNIVTITVNAVKKPGKG
jgi:hypothetical protein